MILLDLLRAFREAALDVPGERRVLIFAGNVSEWWST
jgi:hypothetical protein